MASHTSNTLIAAKVNPVLRQCRPSAHGRRQSQATTVCQVCKIAVLPGDGIGPEISKVAVSTLEAAGQLEQVDFQFTEAHIGGAAIDATGSPLPEDTLEICRASDAVLLAAIGGCEASHPPSQLHIGYALVAKQIVQRSGIYPCRYKWDQLPPEMRPERGLLSLRSGLGTFANLRPAVVLPHLAEASTLKREVVEGVDIMIVRELVGGIYFGQPRVCLIPQVAEYQSSCMQQNQRDFTLALQGFKTNEDGDRIGFNTMVYSEPEVQH